MWFMKSYIYKDTGEILAPKMHLQLLSICIFSDKLFQQCPSFLFFFDILNPAPDIDIHTLCWSSYKKNLSMYVHVNLFSFLLWDG